MSVDKEIAVFDTNVLVSGFLSPAGIPGRIVDWLRLGIVEAVLDDRIAGEYEEVLRRPEFGLPEREVTIVLKTIYEHGHWVKVLPEHTVTCLADPTDAAFVECARVLRSALVTGNKRHFLKTALKDIPVLSPKEFLNQILE